MPAMRNASSTPVSLIAWNARKPCENAMKRASDSPPLKTPRRVHDRMTSPQGSLAEGSNSPARESIETSPRRASTVKVERSVPSNTLTARSEPHNGGSIHARTKIAMGVSPRAAYIRAIPT